VLLLFSKALLEETWPPREVAGEVPDAEVDFAPEFHFPQAMLRNHSADSALSLAGRPAPPAFGVCILSGAPRAGSRDSAHLTMENKYEQ